MRINASQMLLKNEKFFSEVVLSLPLASESNMNANLPPGGGITVYVEIHCVFSLMILSDHLKLNLTSSVSPRAVLGTSI